MRTTKRGTKRIWALLLAACLLLAGCTPDALDDGSGAEDPGDAVDATPAREISSMAELLAWTGERHGAVDKPEVDYARYLNQSASERYVVYDYLEAREFTSGTPMSMEEAMEDLDVLFDILKGAYGMYAYFGGDAAFDAARGNLDAALAQLEQMNMLTTSSFAAMIIEQLDFIEDAYFRVNNQALHEPVISYVYNQTAFYLLESGGFAETASGRVVESVDGYSDLESLFRLSISPEGELVYYPVVMTSETPGEYDGSLVVHYHDGSEQTLGRPGWSSGGQDSGDKLVELRYNGDIPVVFVRNMGYDQAEEDSMQAAQFLEIAEQLADEPVVVVDLRSNNGGNPILPVKWLQIFTGEVVPTNFVSLYQMSEEQFARYGADTASYAYIPAGELEELGGWEQFNEEYYIAGTHGDRTVANDRLLILLVGKSTMSAAEVMVDLAHNMENTLIVGSNTYGSLGSNAYTVIYLPNSAVSVQIGSNLNIFPDGYFEEFTGIEPDLWVNAGDAEELVMQLLERYPFEPGAAAGEDAGGN